LTIATGVIVAGCLADPERRFEIFHGSVVSAECPVLYPDGVP
jgi:hypothetical protein